MSFDKAFSPLLGTFVLLFDFLTMRSVYQVCFVILASFCAFNGAWLIDRKSCGLNPLVPISPTEVKLRTALDSAFHMASFSS